MPEYRRWCVPGAAYFFTVVTYDRRPILSKSMALRALREAILWAQARHPFSVDAIVVLPDHLHCIWTLPDADSAFSMRWRSIKGRFTRLCPRASQTESKTTSSRIQRRERSVWQRRFWEHMVRDELDFQRHADYIHYNPVKHGYASCPHAWSHSSFHRFVRQGFYPPDWCCSCNGRSAVGPRLHGLESVACE